MPAQSPEKHPEAIRPVDLIFILALLVLFVVTATAIIMAWPDICAQWFDSWEDYRNADPDTYEDVNGIGPSKDRELAAWH
jgi:hypothetical protein